MPIGICCKPGRPPEHRSDCQRDDRWETRRGLWYQPASSTYRSDKTGLGPYTQAQLKTKIQTGDTLTFMGVPLGSGIRMGIDRDLNGELDEEMVRRSSATTAGPAIG